MAKSETADRQQIAATGWKALQAAFNAFWTLGERQGAETADENRFGDGSLVADVECERAVLVSFSGIGKPFLFVTEEHGVGICQTNVRRLEEPHIRSFDHEEFVAFRESGE